MPTLDRDGVKIHYEVHGEGPPLILTHGYSSTSAMWHEQIAPLSKRHRLVLWDMRGHGQSDYPEDPGAYSEALTVADIAKLKNDDSLTDLLWKVGDFLYASIRKDGEIQSGIAEIVLC